MKTFTLFIALIVGIIGVAKAQLTDIELSPSNSYSQCVGEWIEYSVSSDYLIVSVDWVVTNGTMTSSQNFASKQIKWDTDKAVGTVEVYVSYSNHAPASKSVNYALKTLHFQTPGNIFGLTNPLEVGVKTLNLSISKMLYPRATSDPQYYYVDDYQWLLPSGWVCNGQTSDGVTPIDDNRNITITTNQAGGGTVKVWGKSDCANGMLSQPKSVSVTRFISDFDISLSGNNTFVDGDQTAIVATAPIYANATYQWTVSSGWSYTGSGNSISVSPDGCDGSVTCLINLGGVLKQEIKNISFEVYKDSDVPIVSGGKTICSSTSTYTCSNLPSGANVSWLKSSNLDGGSSGTSTSFWHKTGTTNGVGWIQAVITSSCNNTKSLPKKTIWAGAPDLDNITVYYTDDLNGYSSEFCPGETNELLARPDPSIDMGLTSNYWDMSNWDIYDEDGEGYVLFEIPTSFSGSEDVSYEIENACNYAIGTITLYEGICGGYYLLMSPNPTSGETLVSLESTNENNPIDESVEWELNVYDQQQNNKLKLKKNKGKTKQIQTHSWKEGVYIVNVKYKNKMLSGRLIVKK